MLMMVINRIPIATANMPMIYRNRHPLSDPSGGITATALAIAYESS